MRISALFIAVSTLALSATPALANQTAPTVAEAEASPSGEAVMVAALTQVVATSVASGPSAAIASGALVSDSVGESTNSVPSTNSVSEENESAISVGGTVVSKYIFNDLFVQTDVPTAQVWASLDTSVIGINGCSFDVFASHGFSTKIGREVDVGASCRFDVAENVNVELSGSRYILGGATDITTLVAKVSHGPLDVSVTQYIVDGPEQDATKFDLGYVIKPVQQLSLRGVLTYERGFGLPDIYTAGVEASYSLNDNWQLTFAGYVPLHRGAGDPRGAVAAVGLQFNF